MDPEFISSSDWQQLANLLHFFWFVLLAAIGFGGNFLMAHAIIPSLLGTGHIPSSLENTRKIFYGGAVLSFVLVVFFVSQIAVSVGGLDSVWGRFWI